MTLPSYQSLSPQQQRLVLITGGAIGLLGISAIIVGLFSNSQESTPVEEQTIATTLTPGGPTPKSTLKKTQSSNSKVTAYPTPTPTPDATYEYFKDALPTDIPPTPTPTPLKGAFYIPNGKQNDLIIKLILPEEWNTLYQVQLINTKTKEIRQIGEAYFASPGDSSFFSNNFSSVIFIGGIPNNASYQKISFYSIPQNKMTKQISLQDMKKAMPALKTESTAVLSRLVPSPDGKRAAFSYGKTFDVSSIDPNTQIIILDLNTYKMTLRPEKGLVNSWRDDATLLYEPAPGNIQEIKL